MAANHIRQVLVVLLCIRAVNLHPAFVCNCNTNITLHTATNGSVVLLTASTSSKDSSPESTTAGLGQPFSSETTTAGLIQSDSPESTTRQPYTNSTLKLINFDPNRVLKREAFDICVSPDCVTAAARILLSMDSKIDPCDNFFEYACGKWNRMNVVPHDKPMYNIFDKLREQIAVVIKGHLEEPKQVKEAVAVTKVKHFYKSCLQDDVMAKVGLTPLYKLLDELGGWPVLNHSAWNASEFDLLLLLTKLRHYNNKVLIHSYAGADDRQSDKNIIRLDQVKTTMHSRRQFKGALGRSYKQFAIDVAVAFGAAPDVAKRDISDMIKFEMSLSDIIISDNKRRDSLRMYKKMKIRELMNNVTGLDWLRYLQLVFHPYGINITEEEEVVVYALGYFSDLINLLETVDNRTLANYIVWLMVMNRVENLSKPYRNLMNNYNKLLLGTEAQSARWSYCVSFVIKHMGDVIGRVVVETSFDQDAKHQALLMVKYIREAFYDLLDQAQFMDKDTRIVAKEKAASIKERIGYPDYILNDTLLEENFADRDFQPDTFFNNMLSHLRYLAGLHIKNLRLKVDKHRWSTTPAVVNAYYSTVKNQIFFPAAILQPPFYSKNHPKSLNFGGIGMIIGHEITHGFDDRGRVFDKDGNMRLWWNQAVIDEFKREAQCIIDQYSNFTVPVININLNGIISQSENIADNGGLKEAYIGYKTWQKKENGGKEEARLPGLEHLSNDQLFFLNFAQVLCGIHRPEFARMAVRRIRSTPGMFRVLGTLQNSHEFAKTYKCPLNSPMNPEKKCRVW